MHEKFTDSMNCSNKCNVIAGHSTFIKYYKQGKLEGFSCF